MKHYSNYLGIFILGILLGGSAVYLLITRSIPISASLVVSSSDPKAQITRQEVTAVSKKQSVDITASFETDRSGIYTNQISLNKKELQYKHLLIFQSAYFFNSHLPFLSIEYSYDWFLVSVKIGYSFSLQKTDYGFGIGVKVPF
ncbi:MAG: hypothetical protein ACRCWI_08565 [Brevinema sp.]